MTEKTLPYFVHAFTNLNTGGGRIKEAAPHKPLVLLSVIQAYESELLTDNRVVISPELISIFKANWNALVTTEHTLGFAMPFFRLKNEPGAWWHLVAKPGCELWVQTGDLSSFSSLTNAVAHVELDVGLAELLHNAQARAVLREVLMTHYFPGQRVSYGTNANLNVDSVHYELLEQLLADRDRKTDRTKKRLNGETYEIELYTREAIFRREVIRLYDDTCCMTGLRVSAPYSFSMVDACHIVPFYKTFNNHPTNGIALCPNLHRAFDKGAIAVDNAYRVIVSPTFVENENSDYRLSALTGKCIRLPIDEQYMPDLAAFAWHREHVFRV